MTKHLLLLCICAGWLGSQVHAGERAEFQTGVDANYSLEMEKAGAIWSADQKSADVFAILAKAGCNSFRVRLWTGDEGASGLLAATETALRAQRAGLNPYLVLFLSDNWADLVKQSVPSIWKDLEFGAKLKAVEEYAGRVSRHFADHGVRTSLYEIGNEIDFGICGEFEEEWPKRVSLDYMRQKRWPQMAAVIAAAQRGVRKVNPDAKFMLHLAQWENAEYGIAFWQFMREHGAAVDVAGLTYYPTSSAVPEHRSLPWFQRQVEKIHSALQCPVVVCEYGYPCRPAFPGQFAEWNKPVPGYTLDEAGQRNWLGDFLTMMRSSGFVSGAYYWSPEWHTSDMWSAFALFDHEGHARPALQSLAPTRVEPPQGLHVYFGNLHSHTSFSDGQGTPEEAFTYARDVAKLDFMAITEHNHLMGGDHATPEQRRALYVGPPSSALMPTAARLNQDGKFIAIYGQEYSSMSKGNHVNVFEVPEVIDVPNGEFDHLLPWMNQHRDSTGAVAVLQFNHPALGNPMARLRPKDYGRDDFGDDAGWVHQMGDVASLIEILNGEPDEKAANKRSPQIMEEDYRRFLQTGFHLAPTGDQDNHHPNWGTATESRTGIIAPALTKVDLLAAMRARHVYATEDRNLKLIFRVNGHLCGDILSLPEPPGNLKIEYEMEDSDEPDADYTIEVFRGSVGGPFAEPIKKVEVKGNTLSGSPGIIDDVSLEVDHQFIYFRVTQRSPSGQDRAWTAPVWLELKK